MKEVWTVRSRDGLGQARTGEGAGGWERGQIRQCEEGLLSNSTSTEVVLIQWSASTKMDQTVYFNLFHFILCKSYNNKNEDSLISSF